MRSGFQDSSSHARMPSRSIQRNLYEMRCSKTGALMKIDANLNNDSSTVKRIAYKFRWIDREGMRAAEEESWKPVMLYENSNLVINTVSPSNKAVDFRLILRSQE